MQRISKEEEAQGEWLNMFRTYVILLQWATSFPVREHVGWSMLSLLCVTGPQSQQRQQQQTYIPSYSIFVTSSVKLVRSVSDKYLRSID